MDEMLGKGDPGVGIIFRLPFEIVLSPSSLFVVVALAAEMWNKMVNISPQIKWLDIILMIMLKNLVEISWQYSNELFIVSSVRLAWVSILICFTLLGILPFFVHFPSTVFFEWWITPNLGVSYCSFRTDVEWVSQFLMFNDIVSWLLTAGFH